MSSTKGYLPHEDRTSTEPRGRQLHSVTIGNITEVNDETRIFRLNIDDMANGVEFLPGQWLDVHFPAIEKAGGYTIISAPGEAAPANTENPQSGTGTSPGPFLELAVQHAPTDQVQRLWGKDGSVLNMPLKVRVGGSFVWPPPGIDVSSIKKSIFIAGGVGINPLISIVSHMHDTNSMPENVHFFYAMRAKEEYKQSNLLSLPRLLAIAGARPEQFCLHVFLTGHPSSSLLTSLLDEHRIVHTRRLQSDDLLETFSQANATDGTVCYVCGPPAMTDEFVDFLKGLPMLQKERVLCEKWW
ncbi:hypothetical protein NA57DRAFT_48001 [Rhizodiscina lignyota]|uniref:Oxidoreductase NAD-binding domain-containing protein 1 n=1 Tax=Rhizodiscina lignyota TaxID=1504668 RepID=A0A9P4M0I6_9PEZI|nr:hypothetical protein NA57DRAFT_48001 [Rhizodiscina lignyota]